MTGNTEVSLENSDRPLPEEVAHTLAKEHGLKDEDVSIEFYDEGEIPGIGLKLRNDENLYCVDVYYLRGAKKDRSVFDLTVDALSAIAEMLAESDYAYRVLPQGDDVTFMNAQFRILVEMRVPGLDAWANQILAEGDDPSTRN